MRSYLIVPLSLLFVACGDGPTAVDDGPITKVVGDYILNQVNGMDRADSNLVFEVRESCILDNQLETSRFYSKRAASFFVPIGLFCSSGLGCQVVEGGRVQRLLEPSRGRTERLAPSTTMLYCSTH